MRPSFRRSTALNPRRGSVISRLAYVNFSLWAPLVALVLFLALPQTDAARRATDKFQRAFAPIAAVLASPVQGGRRLVNHLNQWLFAIKRNQLLQRELAALNAENQKTQELLVENRRLAALLNLTTPQRMFQTTAMVTADTSGAFARSVLVSAGADDGVEKWDVVTASGGILGKVVSTTAKSARVLLITDTNSGIPVMSIDGGFRAIMRGDNSPFPLLDFVEPHDMALNEGTKLVTSGHGGHFAPGMRVGKLIDGRRVKLGAMVEPWVSITRYGRK